MKIAVAAIAAYAAANTAPTFANTFTGVKATLKFDEPADGAASLYYVQAWVQAADSSTTNYILVKASKTEGTYAATATTLKAREWVLLQYDNADVQDYWQVDYTAADATNWATTDPAILNIISYSGATMVSADSGATAVTLSTAAQPITTSSPI